MDSEKLEQIKYRLQLLKALELFQNNLHEIIDIGIQCKTSEDFKTKLIEDYSLSDAQAQVIIDTQIKRITKLNKEDLLKESKELSNAIQTLEATNT